MLELNKVYCMDCLEGLKKLENNSVDCIIIDPPYNVLALEWDKQIINWGKLARELFRVIRWGGTIYIFGQTPFIFKVFESMKETKFEFKQDLVWIKNRGFSLTKTIYTKYHENILFFWKSPKAKIENFGGYVKKCRLKKGFTTKKCRELCGLRIYKGCGNAGYLWYETGNCPTKEIYLKIKEILELDNRFDNLFDKPIFNFEDIKLEGEPYKYKKRKEHKLYGIKNIQKEYKGINKGKRNPKTTLNYNTIQTGREYVGHPTQKPIALLRYLIKASTNKGDLILDCFMGSGSTAVACKQMGRNFLGIENNPIYIKMCRKRLSQQVLNL